MNLNGSKLQLCCKMETKLKLKVREISQQNGASVSNSVVALSYAFGRLKLKC